MAKLHTHYVTNAQKELKYAYIGLSEDAFQSSVQQALLNAEIGDDFINSDEEADNFSDDEDDDDDNVNDENGNTLNTKNMEIEKWINIDNSELKKLLDVDVSIVIEPHPITIDHGSSVFNLEATLDSVLGPNT